MSKDVRIYVAGTTKAPEKRNRGGAKRVFKRYTAEDKLYYKKGDQYFCVIDDLSARGYVLPSENGTTRFVPHDYDDLLTFEQFKKLCREAGLFIPNLNDAPRNERIPPPLFIIKSPHRARPVWNRSAILRHIDSCMTRRSNAN